MKYTKLFILVCLVVFSFKSYSAPTEDDKSKNKSKIEELFIWKVSDELRLGEADEKKIRQIVRDLTDKKNKINMELEALTEKKIDKKESGKVINNYKKLLEEYNKLSLEEIDKVSSVLGVEKTYSYLKIKSEVMNKLKSILTVKPQKLEEPKVIEE